tara:strand:- start:21876 stop:22133 length:258 start_codon:yes stop_codon:yes gene_type:complete
MYFGKLHSSNVSAGVRMDRPLCDGESKTTMPFEALNAFASVSDLDATAGCSMYRFFSNTGRSDHASAGASEAPREGGAIAPRQRD